MTEKAKKGIRNYPTIIFFVLLLLSTAQALSANTSTMNSDNQNEEKPLPNKTYRISAIKIHGNITTSQNAILNHIPYKIGEIFDARKTKTLIRNLYYNLKK